MTFVRLFCLAFLLSGSGVTAQAAGNSGRAARVVLAHYMPWYTANPSARQWGWHWTMNHFDPARQSNGRREAASQYYPIIGTYDSGDPDVLEYHLLLMKLAGIDGVIVDWYGLESFRDYAILHQNTIRLVEQLRRFDMKLVICYEDQTITALEQAGRIPATGRVSHAKNEIRWLAEHWFKLTNYVRIDGHPVLLSFGYGGLSGTEWTRCLTELNAPIAYFSEHAPRDGATGAYDWPIPTEGLAQVDRFEDLSRQWKHAIPVVFPRFVDIYAKAGVSQGYARIEDDNGKTFQRTIKAAMESEASLIQIATWNDWGEGTQVEPSQEFGYRDLVSLQEARRKYIHPDFGPREADLELPIGLFQLRRSGNHEPKQLDQIAQLIAHGELQKARSQIDLVGNR